MRIVLASGNAGKIKEFTELLTPLGIEIVPQSKFQLPPAEELGVTFVENALQKARYVSSETGLPTIADDSGLVIDYLNGEPGIYSARYAGFESTSEKNMEVVLQKMRGVPTAQRHARFYCCLVFMNHAEDPTPLICEGIWEGAILESAEGEGGFGYDPIFYVPTHACSAASLPPGVKNQMSHRALAFQKIMKRLPSYFQPVKST